MTRVNLWWDDRVDFVFIHINRECHCAWTKMLEFECWRNRLPGKNVWCLVDMAEFRHHVFQNWPNLHLIAHIDLIHLAYLLRIFPFTANMSAAKVQKIINDNGVGKIASAWDQVKSTAALTHCSCFFQVALPLLQWYEEYPSELGYRISGCGAGSDEYVT